LYECQSAGVGLIVKKSASYESLSFAPEPTVSFSSDKMMQQMQMMLQAQARGG